MGQITWHLKLLYNLPFGPAEGIPKVRSWQDPCGEFRYGEPSGQCHSDGHYLCDECKWADPLRGEDQCSSSHYFATGV